MPNPPGEASPMNPDEMAQKYFRSLSARSTAKDHGSSSTISIPQPYQPGKVVRSTSLTSNQSPMDILSLMPSVGEWVEVTQGIYAGEVAEVTRIDEAIGMIYARAAPWSLRSVLSSQEIETTTKQRELGQSVSETGLSHVSLPTLRNWLSDTQGFSQTSPSKPIGSIIVHKQNVKRISVKAALDRKGNSEKSASDLTVGLLVRLQSQSDDSQDSSKSKYVVLRFFEGDYALICKKKLLKPNDQDTACLVKQILLDRDTFMEETVFVPDVDSEEPVLCEAKKCSSEPSGFLIVQSDALSPTVGKRGEDVMLLDGRLTAESKESIERALGKKIASSAPHALRLVGEVAHKDKVNGSVEVQVVDSEGRKHLVKLQLNEVCAFVNLST